MSKVVLITGGSSGIGKSIGEFLTKNGFIVYGTSRNPQNYSESKFPILKLDVKSIETIKDTIQAI
ncbi:MAG: SDR family NAD(P)-dependent oxidoreductase, partial [Flavobacteriales bacterium]